MIIPLLSHVILKPHVHPEDILGIGVLCLAVAIVLLAMLWGRKERS